MSYGISKINAKNFVKKWKGKGNENQDCQLLGDVTLINGLLDNSGVPKARNTHR